MTATPARCLVTGAAGFVGSHLVETLVDRGYEVSCLVRKTSNLAWLKPLPVRFVFGDVLDADSLPGAVEGMDYVYHVAGAVKALREADFFLVNAGGTANLLEACAAPGQSLQRFVLVSSQAAAGPPEIGHPLTEDDPPRPITPYGLSKLRAEVLTASYAARLPVTVVRPPAIYGPRDRETLTVFQWINRGLCPVPRQKRFFSLIHVRDLVTGLILAAESPASVGRTYHLANDGPESLEGMSTLIAQALGRHPVTLRLPQAAFDLAGGASTLAGRLRRRPQIFDRYKAMELSLPSWVYDTRRARAELGFQASISVPDGVRETTDWYRKAGWL